MKRNFFPIVAAVAIFSFAACNDDKAESAETKETQTPAISNPAPTKQVEPNRTEVSVGPDGAEIKTKSGSEIKVSEGGTQVGTKDVKVNVDTKKKPPNN